MTLRKCSQQSPYCEGCYRTSGMYFLVNCKEDTEMMGEPVDYEVEYQYIFNLSQGVGFNYIPTKVSES